MNNLFEPIYNVMITGFISVIFFALFFIGESVNPIYYLLTFLLSGITRIIFMLFTGEINYGN
jgi:hypothetical protein